LPFLLYYLFPPVFTFELNKSDHAKRLTIDIPVVPLSYNHKLLQLRRADWNDNLPPGLSCETSSSGT